MDDKTQNDKKGARTPHTKTNLKHRYVGFVNKRVTAFPGQERDDLVMKCRVLVLDCVKIDSPGRIIRFFQECFIDKVNLCYSSFVDLRRHDDFYFVFCAVR